MTNAFIKAQFMDPPGSGTSAASIGAVKAGSGITIAADGTISTSAGGGTVSNIVPSNGIQGGGTGPTVFLGLLPPAGVSLGGVKTVDGSGLSIDADGVIRVSLTTTISGGPGIQVTDLGGRSYSIAATPATNAVLGSVIVSGGANGLRVASSGLLTLAPASPSVLGGIIPGTNCSVTPDGTLNVAGGGTITGVGVGTGLGGGGTSGAVTVFLNPASGTTIGGVYQGDNITIAPDGRISSTGGGVTSVSGSAPITITGTLTAPIVGVNAATTSTSGVVTLSDSVSSTSITEAATPNSVKQAYDLAVGALPLVGGAMSGPIAFTVGQTFPGVLAEGALGGVGAISISGTLANPLIEVASATASSLGVVQPDGSTITVNSSGVISAGGGTLQTVTDAGATTTNPIAVTSSSFSSTIENQTIQILELVGGQQAFTLSNTGGAASLTYGNGTFATAGLYFDQLNGTTLSTWSSLPVNINSGRNVVITTNDGGGPTYTLGIDHFTITDGGMIVDGNVQIINGSGLSVEGIFTNQGLTYPLGDGTAGQVLSTNGAGNCSWVTMPGADALLKTGGTMTGNITFNAGQTFPGTISASLLDVTGDIVYASGPNTPASLPIGTAGTILAVNAGLPAWRTATQLGLLTSSAAASTYATINSPTFTGPVIVNTGGVPGANAMTISGGNLVLSTAYTPSSSSDTGSVGEIAWDDTGYLYFCYLPNTWGRIQIDLTPF